MNDIELVKKIKKDVENDISNLVNKLNTHSLFVFIIESLEDIFNPVSNRTNKFLNFTNEELAEELSYVLSLQNSKKLYKALLSPSEKIDKKNIYQLISLLQIRNIVKDMEIYIGKQDYYLNKKMLNKNILLIDHPVLELKKSYKSGYLRDSNARRTENINAEIQNELQASNTMEFFLKQNVLNYKIKDLGTLKERILFDLNHRATAQIIPLIKSKEQQLSVYDFKEYLDNSNISLNDRTTKNGNIRWIDLINFANTIYYISYFINWIIENKATTIIMKENSKFILFDFKKLFELFTGIFKELNSEITEKEVKNFINRFKTKLNSSNRIDLQFKPILEIDVKTQYCFLLLNTFSKVNLISAYLSKIPIIADQGERFEKKVFKLLQDKFSNIYESIKYTDFNANKSEIDIFLIGNKTIYIFELKNVKPPISATSSSSTYEHMQKALKQLEQSKEYFNKDRNGFLKKHLNISLDDIESYQLVQAILFSNRIFSGLDYNGTAIRDIYSLQHLLEIGYIEKSIVESRSIIENKKASLYQNNSSFQEIDFIDYLSKDSEYMSFFSDNIFYTPTQIKYKDYIFQIDNYVFEIYNI